MVFKVIRVKWLTWPPHPEGHVVPDGVVDPHRVEPGPVPIQVRLQPRVVTFALTLKTLRSWTTRLV